MPSKKPSIASEFDCADLGDERLEARLALIAESLAGDAKLSLPEALGDGAELEGAYRFFNNPRVEPDAILRPHVSASAARLAEHERVLVVHDTTEFVFGGRTQRQGLEGDRFRAHMSLGVSADGRREPLGVLALKTWVRAEKKAVRTTKERRLDDDRESKRWLEQSLAVEAAVGRDVVLIHVEDREADIFESLSKRVMLNMRFIVRAQSLRAINVEGERRNILEHLRAQVRRFERTVTLSRRQVGRGLKNTYEDRDGRKARLAFAAAHVVLERPRVDADGDPINVNVVHVIEVEPPEGEEPVEWLLLTTEPIATVDDIEFVVDSYRARWVIEEYFKALKTGCAYEARQLESYDALRRALAIYAVIAWRLLWMRYLTQHAPTTPASVVATKAELGVLRAQKRIGADATVGDFLNAVAKMGGHIKRNGPAGWQVLWRGYRTLGDLAAGFALGRADDASRSDQW